MIRRTQQKRGRPLGPRPLFIEACKRLCATTLLSKARGRRAVQSGVWRLSWTDGGQAYTRTVRLTITSAAL